MQPLIRPAREGDAEAIASWTRDTFFWGDYVADAIPDWMAEPGSMVLVAEIEGLVVGTTRALLMSPAEAWAQGSRVHPDHRRRGIGNTLARGLLEWAADQGARVIRVLVENWNDAAKAATANLDYRPVAGWVRASRGVGENSPVPEGNGGRRVMAEEGLRPAHSSEAAPAMMSWSGGPLERAARGLVPIGGWRWRRLVAGDLADAARRRALLSGRPGWAIGEIQEDRYEVSWISTDESDVHAMLRALVDRAAAAGVDGISVMAPSSDWLVQALRRRGFDIHDMTIYAKPL